MQDIKRHNAVFFLAVRLEHGGGAEKFMIDTCLLLSRQVPFFKVTIVSPSVNWMRAIEHLSMMFHYGHPAIRKYPDRNPNVREFLRQANIDYITFESLAQLSLIIKKADIVYTRNEITDLSFLHLSRSALTPHVIGVHTPLHYGKSSGTVGAMHNALYSSRMYQWLGSKAKKWHAANLESVSRIRKLHGTADIALFGYPCNVDKLPVNASIGTRTKKFIDILWVGRFEWQKGADLLARLVRTTCNRNVQVRWTLLGSGTMFEDVKSQLQSVDRCQLLGNVPESLVWKYLCESDIFVSTSRWECWPNTVVSSLEAGLTIIATRIAGHTDMLENVDNAFLADTVDEIANLIINISYNIPIKTPRRYSSTYSNQDFISHMVKLLV